MRAERHLSVARGGEEKRDRLTERAAGDPVLSEDGLELSLGGALPEGKRSTYCSRTTPEMRLLRSSGFSTSSMSSSVGSLSSVIIPSTFIEAISVDWTTTGEIDEIAPIDPRGYSALLCHAVNRVQHGLKGRVRRGKAFAQVRVAVEFDAEDSISLYLSGFASSTKPTHPKR